MGISCKNVTKTYISQESNIRALTDVTFRIEDHQFVSLVGPSGCGKTTLLKMIAGLIHPDFGTIEFEGAPRKGQPRTAMVFQEQGLFPWMNVIENMAFGLEMQGLPKEEYTFLANEFLKKFGLDGFGRSYPHQLSGGMKQRVALGRAFLTDPQILLMDEPFGALDSQTRFILQEELLLIWREQKKTVFFITHDIEEAIILSDRVLVMTDRPGRIHDDIYIDIPRPRDNTSKHEEQIKEIKWPIWKMMENEVRKNLKTLP